MSPYVAITTMNVGGREFVLAEVARGMGKLGTFRCITTSTTTTDVFFIEDEPVINIFNPYTVVESTDKVIHQISAPEKNAEVIISRFSAALDNYYLYEQGLARSLMPVLELLCPGLYVVHEAQMHPSDGNGRYFWTAYTNPQEYHGTSEKNSGVGHANFTPSFLVPTRHPADFRIQHMLDCEANQKRGKPLVGLCYHITGMFSALLDGHHAATAALHNDIPFKCLLIEPLNGILYNNTEGLAGIGKSVNKSRIQETEDTRRIVALSCPFVNVPLEELPDESLERFLIARRSVKPVTFNTIKPKMNKAARTITKRALPMAIYDKAAQLPTSAMVAEASGVDFLSEEQLEALSSGEVKHSDEYIISSNLHTSISAACTYLQILDFERFLQFTVGILENEELVSVHKFVAERLYGIIHPEIHKFFVAQAANSAEGGDSEAKSNIICEVANKYITRYDEHIQKRTEAENSYANQRSKLDRNKKAITHGKGIATLEAAAKGLAANKN